MDQLNAAQTIFTLFFAIFWSTVANKWPHWKPFHWSLPKNRTRLRAWLSFALLNVIPILTAALILWLLAPVGKKALADTFLNWLFVFAVGAIPAFCILGLSRIWVGLIERWPNWFYYSRDELHSFGYQSGSGEVELEPSIETLKLDQSSTIAVSDICVGIYQVVIPFAIALAAHGYAA